MIIEIPTDTFWKCAKDFYPVKGEWHLLDYKIQNISKKILGLAFLESTYSLKMDDGDISGVFFKFKVINLKKFTWARMKYGI